MDATTPAQTVGVEIYLGPVWPAPSNSTPLALNLSLALREDAPGNLTGDLSEHQQYVIALFLSCLYTIFLFPIGFVGNILILVVNISFREKMTIPDLYFINLAAADLILVADSLIEVFNLDEQYYDIAVLCFADVREVQWLEVTLGFIMPFAIIGLCYSLIVRALIRAHRHRGLRPRRQKALRMIFAVVLVFFICWLPENVFISVHLLQWTQPGDTPCKQSFRHAYPLTGHIVNLAAFSNSCLNPLIYSFLGETFRDKLRLYVEQKTSLPALNRFCHATLKAVIPDSTEQSEVRFSSAV